jgi:diketogulonate reductase-like aldo/keto reductase
VEFHPFLYQKQLLQYCRTNEIVIQAYSPLTHGRRLGDPRLFGLATRYSRSPAQILIRWALQHDLVVLPKSVRKERIVENAAVFDFEIAPGDMQFLDGVDENLRTCWDPTNVP